MSIVITITCPTCGRGPLASWEYLTSATTFEKAGPPLILPDQSAGLRHYMVGGPTGPATELERVRAQALGLAYSEAPTDRPGDTSHFKYEIRCTGVDCRFDLKMREDEKNRFLGGEARKHYRQGAHIRVTFRQGGYITITFPERQPPTDGKSLS